MRRNIPKCQKSSSLRSVLCIQCTYFKAGLTLTDNDTEQGQMPQKISLQNPRTRVCERVSGNSHSLRKSGLTRGKQAHSQSQKCSQRPEKTLVYGVTKTLGRPSDHDNQCSAPTTAHRIPQTTSKTVTEACWVCTLRYASSS